MQCDQIRELLEAYALNMLDADERARVESHLATCADCRQLADEYAEVVNRLPLALAAASPLQAPALLKSRVLQSVQASSPRRQYIIEKSSARSWFNLRTVGALALIVLLIAASAWA